MSEAPRSPEDRRPHCPSCGAPVNWSEAPARPFCSLACQLIELHRWLDEHYRIPGAGVPRSSSPPDATTAADARATAGGPRLDVRPAS